jgi:hypothetical protein
MFPYFNKINLVYERKPMYICSIKLKENEKMNVATEILNQLGGSKFLAMTGSKNLIDCGNALSMRLTTNKIKAKYLKIEITSNDTYNMTFSTSKKMLDEQFGFKVDTLVVLKEYKNVYADMLQNIFTEVTGLLTSLGTMGR